MLRSLRLLPRHIRVASRQASWRGTLAVAALFVLAGLLAGANWEARQSVHARERAAAWQAHTYQVIDRSEQLKLAVLSARRGERVFALTHDARFLDTYLASREEAPPLVDELRRLTADRTDQSSRVNLIGRDVHAYFARLTKAVNHWRAGDPYSAGRQDTSSANRSAVEHIVAAIDALEGVERTLLRERNATADRSARTLETYLNWLSAVGLAMLATAMCAAIMLRRALVREAAARRELELRATTDELTGLANRRETLAAIDRMLAGSRRSGRPLALAILDIDHFKRVNDAHGHPAGDEVIRRVAQIALEVMRDQDLVGRLGGEEFVIVLPDSTAQDAMIACERLRRSIGDTTIILPDKVAVTVTLSMGLAEAVAGDDRIRLIARADNALYRAKQGGRDQVLLAA